jgi:hypothetical protein
MAPFFWEYNVLLEFSWRTGAPSCVGERGQAIKIVSAGTEWRHFLVSELCW